MNSNRLRLIDTIRGFAFINMVLYHLLWDLVYIYDVNILWYKQRIGHLWQLSICATFIVLSGFCFHLGHRKIKRAFYVIGASVIISGVTFIFMQENKIIFGILWFIGTTMLIMLPLERIMIKIKPMIGIIGSLFLYILSKDIGKGKITFFNIDIFYLPRSIYANLFTTYFGFAPADFTSADYFPLLPWIWLYIMGYFIYLVFKKYDLLEFLKRHSIIFLEWIGRHTLILYMLHQVVIYGILYVVFNIL